MFTTLPLGVLVGELTLTGQDFIDQLELGHSGYVIPLNEGQSNYLFVGLNEVSSDGKTGYYYWTMSILDESAADEANYWTRAATKEKILEFVREQAQSLPAGPLRNIIDKTRPEGVRNKQMTYYNLELRKEDVPPGRVVLLGDSAHTMTPCKSQASSCPPSLIPLTAGTVRGEGGVCALLDSLDLSRAIARIAATQAQGADLEKVMAEYNDVMIPRGRESVIRSRQVIRTDGKPAVKHGDTPRPRIAWGEKAVPTPKTKITI